MPETPISESAARTSSSLKGLIMAVINFILDSGQRWAVTTILLRLHATGTAICGCSGPAGVLRSIALPGQAPTRYKDWRHARGGQFPRNPRTSPTLTLDAGPAPPTPTLPPPRERLPARLLLER